MSFLTSLKPMHLVNVLLIVIPSSITFLLSLIVIEFILRISVQRFLLLKINKLKFPMIDFCVRNQYEIFRIS